MGFIEKKSSVSAATTKKVSTNKISVAKKRTLAKQQQISERLADFASELLGKVQEGVSAIEQLKSAMEQIASASEENAGAAEESLSAVNEITKNTESTIEQAKSIIAKTNTMLNQVTLSGKKVNDTAIRLDKGLKTSNELVEKSKDLKKASENIGEAVTVIAKVADQTNLLALNAAIEAARAKEHGKGFAVVAGETRSLAAVNTESAEATREVVNAIQNSIDKVEKNITEVGDIVKTSYEKVENTTTLSNDVLKIGNDVNSILNEISSIFAKLIDEIEELQKGSETIASAAEEQASAVNQATSAIDMQASALTQSEQAAQNLESLADELKNSTDVAKDAEEIASMAEELSSAVEEIIKSMGEITTALEQIEKAAALANEDAIKNTEVAQSSLKMIEEVNNINENLLNKVNDITTKLSSIHTELKALFDLTKQSVEKGIVSSKEMGEVEKSVKHVSKILRNIENTIIQTTMLAVSGSIEAARAGEFGKGFAVVSSDIRNLAQEAKSNLEKINDILDELDNETKFIISEWNLFMNSQDGEKIQIELMANEIKNLVESMKEIVELLGDIKRANEENHEALNQAVIGAEQIQQAAELTKNNATESKEAARLIEETISDVGRLVEELAVLADELQ